MRNQAIYNRLTMKRPPKWLFAFILAVLAGLAVEWLTPLSLFGSAWSFVAVVLSSTWGWAIEKSHVANWFLYGLIIAVIVLFLALVRILANVVRKPAYHSYTEDNFLGVHWKWKFYDDTISDPIPYCPNCQMQLINAFKQIKGRDWRDEKRGVALHCESCNKRDLLVRPGEYYGITRQIKRLIERKIRTKEWNGQADK